ncbi:hypothetical protein BLNAU_3845 [Blattamonas nauphoetae]|uniref:Uncharacterized protein n=1 Tax=Blattamonas nauphoetae TaxID=2049346 RepID=A0ABQ9YBC7_9EUKA|nr:hypothetical protein BLNAU_3845 [Blattamonas nauphoetae]
MFAFGKPVFSLFHFTTMSNDFFQNLTSAGAEANDPGKSSLSSIIESASLSRSHSDPHSPHHLSLDPRTQILAIFFSPSAQSLTRFPQIPPSSSSLSCFPSTLPHSPPPLPKMTSSRHSHSATPILHPPTLPSSLLPIHDTAFSLHPASRRPEAVHRNDPTQPGLWSENIGRPDLGSLGDEKEARDCGGSSAWAGLAGDGGRKQPLGWTASAVVFWASDSEQLPSGCDARSDSECGCGEGREDTADESGEVPD